MLCACVVCVCVCVCVCVRVVCVCVCLCACVACILSHKSRRMLTVLFCCMELMVSLIGVLNLRTFFSSEFQHLEQRSKLRHSLQRKRTWMCEVGLGC